MKIKGKLRKPSLVMMFLASLADLLLLIFFCWSDYSGIEGVVDGSKSVLP